MVYCTNCGAESPDDAIECKNCGASLRVQPYRAHRKREDEWCFGSTRSGVPVWGIAFGILIILAGVISLLEGRVPWATWSSLWPLLVIIVGLVIVISALTRR